MEETFRTIKDMLNAGFPLLYLVTSEYSRVTQKLRKIAFEGDYTWGRKINCVMRRFFPSSSVGDRPAPRGCTSTPDERKVTTI